MGDVKNIVLPKALALVPISNRKKGTKIRYIWSLMQHVKLLKCSMCGREHSLSEGLVMCPRRDNGRLDIVYDYESIGENLSRKALEQRRGGLWKYEELLPVDKKYSSGLSVGDTPLFRAVRLGEKLRATNVIIKDETRGPSASFKDRSMAVGVAKAIELGYSAVVTASSGNAAAALAAQSAAAGLQCTAFVIDSASLGKLAQLIQYGAKVFRVKGLGSEDPTVRMMLLCAERYGWYPCPSFDAFNPYQVEGPKTISYEAIEQLGWEIPDWVLVPSGAGCLMAGLWKGFKDFYELGFARSMPRLVVIQSTGNAPIVRAYEQGRRGHNIEPWGCPKTIATGLEDPYPWDGDAALDAARETKGTCVAVEDTLILEAQRLLASKEGVFGEPSGVAGLAGLMRLLDDGTIDSKDKVLVPITGSGMKDLSMLENEAKAVPAIEPLPGTLERLLG